MSSNSVEELSHLINANNANPSQQPQDNEEDKFDIVKATQVS